MTSLDFCKRVNKSLIPNSTLEPGYPRKVPVERHLDGFINCVLISLRTERNLRSLQDVIELTKNFLRRMAINGFLHPSNATTEDSLSDLATDIYIPTLDACKKQ